MADVSLWPLQTFLFARRMSAFGGKADIAPITVTSQRIEAIGSQSFTVDR
jgi:hypothetical protein